MITSDPTPDKYGEAASMYRHEAKSDAAIIGGTISFRDLCVDLGISSQDTKLRRAIGPRIRHQAIVAVIEPYLTPDLKSYAGKLADAHIREIRMARYARDSSYAQAAE